MSPDEAQEEYEEVKEEIKKKEEEVSHDNVDFGIAANFHCHVIG